MATALGRSSGDYVLDSYRGLFVRALPSSAACRSPNMLFDDE